MNGKFYVWSSTFAIVKAKKIPPKAFAVIRDKNELTVVVDSSELDFDDVIDIDEGWNVITFDMVMDFSVVGFLAQITAALAEENISIFALSSYSTDHILVKEDCTDRAVEKLKKAGFEQVE